MRRLVLIVICLICFALPGALHAQDGAGEPPAGAASVAELDAAVAEAQDAASIARRYAEEASNFLNIFESIGVAISVLTGLVIPMLVLLAGFVGWRQLKQAKTDVTEAHRLFAQELNSLRDTVAQDLQSKQTDLDTLKGELVRQLNSLRDTVAQDMQSKQDDLDTLKGELIASAQYERVRSDQATLALSLLPLAERQYRANDFEGALHTYLRALELDPNNIVIHYRLGYVYTQQDDLDAAEEYLKRALRLDANFAPALANLGFVYRKRAERLPPDDITRRQLMVQAEGLLLKALKLSPKLVDEDGESWWGSLGGLHRRRGQIEDAINAYEQASKITPAASYPVGNLATLYIQQGDHARMMETFRKAERLAERQVVADGSDFWSWADLLVARLALGSYDKAEDALEWLLSSAPATHMLQRPVDTLRQLMTRVDDEAAVRIRSFVERMEVRLAQQDGAQALTP